MGILAREPGNAGALAGMGWIRSQQGNFPAAISFLEQARLKRPNDHTLAMALELDRFRFLMSEARYSLASNDLIAADRQIIAQVHGRGLKIYGATILPFQGFVAWTPAGEAKRQAVNEWIKTGGVFDGVIDFAAAVGDRASPTRLARGKDSGDHLHPSDAGYAAMANAIDLAMLRRSLQ